MTTIQAQQTSPAPPINNLTHTGGAGSPAVATSPAPVVTAQAARGSYANATKKSATPPSIAASIHAPPPAAGSNQASLNATSLVNGRAPPAMPVGHTAPSSAEHTKKSSVTISAAGASGNIPNGGPVLVPPAARPTINFGNFGSTPPRDSPPISKNVPFPNQPNSLSAQMGNPRITSPATSPSPIPQPAASGGRPPSGFQASQGNAPNFGSIGSMPGDSVNLQMRGMQLPSAPMAQGPQATHLRRDSSQSQHGDMGPQLASSPGGMMNRSGFMPPAGRGRQYSGQGFPQQSSFSPAPGYRTLPNQNRGAPNMPPHFQNQVGMQQYPNSPHMAPRSPALQGSHPSTPQMQQAHMINNQQYQFQPPYSAYASQLGPQAGHFGVQPGFDPAYPYYQQQYQGPPYMQGPPLQTPGQFNKRMPSQPMQHYSQAQYNQPPSQNMSRTSSQVSERPASTVGQSHGPPPSSQTPASTHISNTNVSDPLSSANFVLPNKSKSKTIVIKDADGNVVNFDQNKKSSPARSVTPAQAPSPAPSSTTAAPSLAPPKSTSPAIVSSTPTPPPQSSTLDVSQTRPVKTDAEKKADFQEQISAKAAKAAQAKAESETKLTQDGADEASEPPKTEEVVDAAATEKVEDEKAEPEEDEAARLKREEDERIEREIAEMEAEMEAKEREEEEREKVYQAKKKAEAELRAAKEKEEAEMADEDMRRAEREAEAAEEAREKERNLEREGSEPKAERDILFMNLKKPTIGPGADLEPSSGTATPMSDDSSIAPPQKTPLSAKPNKPAALKLETAKPVEPAQPTPGMQALSSARFLELQREAVTYPEGIRSPNPALNQGGKRNGRLYDVAFLRQFQEAFKEKPSLDWDQKLKETVGDPSDSAQPKSARSSGSGLGARQVSRGPVPAQFQGIGNFTHGGRTLPPGTTSADRFNASSFGGQPRPPMNNPIAAFPGRTGGFPMGSSQPMSRTNSLQTMPAHSPRQGSQRGKQASRRGDRTMSKKEEEAANKAMPLTAGSDLKPLELSGSGWKPASIVNPAAAGAVGPNGHMPPDMVQRKVKAALNKMTPERFDKLADEILKIAGQSKDETDGRTLRQVIALTFEKACDEAHWASMYAKFCKRMLEDMSADIKDEAIRDKNDKLVTGGPLFRKYLLNRCQEEFERGWEVNLPDKPEGQTEEAAMLSDEYYIAAAAKRKGLGLIQFIGELYKLGMLSIRIMHECVLRLLNFTGMPDESAIESLVKLLRTVGATMDSTDQGPGLINSYFERIASIMNMPELPSRMHFMLLDTVDLRKASWQDKNAAKGPKTIQEIREQAALAQQQADLERARQNQRGGRGPPMGRGDARNFSGGPMPPPDYPKNQVGMDDLRRLGNRVNSRQANQGPSNLGPNTMLGSRSGSGRASSQLGPGGMLRNDSNNTSRTGTPPAQTKKDETTVNAFSALAGLDPSGEEPGTTPATSPSITNAKPATSVATATESDAAAKDVGSKVDDTEGKST